MKLRLVYRLFFQYWTALSIIYVTTLGSVNVNTKLLILYVIIYCIQSHIVWFNIFLCKFCSWVHDKNLRLSSYSIILSIYMFYIKFTMKYTTSKLNNTIYNLRRYSIQYIFLVYIWIITLIVFYFYYPFYLEIVFLYNLSIICTSQDTVRHKKKCIHRYFFLFGTFKYNVRLPIYNLFVVRDK